MIATLDYSKPPPGYEVNQDLSDEPGLRWGTHLRPLWSHETEWESAWLSTPEVACAAAWAHYKASNDPPGCSEIFRCGGLKRGRVVRGWKFRFGIDSDETFHVDRQFARVAAWAWYDRRLVAHERVVSDSRHQIEISTRGDGAPPPCPTWPRFLNCSDTEIGEVERWLADSEARFPEVLLG